MAKTELLSAAEVAELAGVKTNTIHAYLARGQMPQPHVRLASGPIWTRAQIDRWLTKRRDQP